jgi:hypothetical protein
MVNGEPVRREIILPTPDIIAFVNAASEKKIVKQTSSLELIVIIDSKVINFAA